MIKLFTHTDLDGVGCAVLAKLVFGYKKLEIEYCNYDEINEKVKHYILNDIEKNDVCYITDISITEDLAEYINENNLNFYLFDHHQTALDLNKYDWCTVKIEDKFTNYKTCGTELYYNWLAESGCLNKNVVLDKFVEVIRDYDTWRWSTIGENGIISKQINDLFYLYGRDAFIDWCMLKIYDCEFPLLSKSDKLLLDLKQKEIDDYIETKDKTMFITTMGNHTFGVVFAERFFSELGNKLCIRHPEIDYVAMINMDGTVSYRTIKDDINLGIDVAKLYGGGGHPKSAGSQFGSDIRLKTMESIFC